jgi:hypothetical protein
MRESARDRVTATVTIAGFTAAAHISAMFAPFPISGYNGAAAAARGGRRADPARWTNTLNMQ